MLRRALGVVCFLVGALWFGQGIGVVGGSSMTGHAVWAVIGVPLAIVGVVLASRRPVG